MFGLKTTFAATALIFCGTLASAATLSFDDEAAFNAAIGETPDAFIDFETGFADGDNVNGTTINGATFTSAAGNSATIESGAGSIGGSNPIGVFTLEVRETSGTALTISFDSAITYFGLLYNDVGSPDFNGVTFASTAANGDSQLFAGLTFDLADNVTQIVVSSLGGSSGVGLDNIRFGSTPSPVPLPAGLPLLLGAGALLGGLRLRKARRAA